MKIRLLDRDRKYLGLDYEMLSKKLGVTKTAISKWLSGENFPKAVHVRKMIELGISKEAAINPSKETEI